MVKVTSGLNGSAVSRYNFSTDVTTYVIRYVMGKGIYGFLHCNTCKVRLVTLNEQYRQLGFIISYYSLVISLLFNE